MTDLLLKSKPANRKTKSHTQKKKPSRRHNTPKSRATHESILEAAIDLYVENGFHQINTAKIAQRAGITRGCMQYYFPTTDSVIHSSARFLNNKIMEQYRVLSRSQPKKFDIKAFNKALDVYFSAEHNRYYLAWTELYNASRTDENLRTLMEDLEAELDAYRLKSMKILFPDIDDYDSQRYQTAHDLIRMVMHSWPTLIFGRDEELRRENLKKAVKESLFRLWRLEPFAD